MLYQMQILDGRRVSESEAADLIAAYDYVHRDIPLSNAALQALARMMEPYPKDFSIEYLVLSRIIHEEVALQKREFDEFLVLARIEDDIKGWRLIEQESNQSHLPLANVEHMIKRGRQSRLAAARARGRRDAAFLGVLMAIMSFIVVISFRPLVVGHALAEALLYALAPASGILAWILLRKRTMANAVALVK